MEVLSTAAAAVGLVSTATPTRIHLTTNDIGNVKLYEQTDAVAKKTSELLQQNHDDFHIFFNNKGFHNHIAHHLLTLYGLGASAETIQKAYDQNAEYQSPKREVQPRNVESMHDPAKFRSFLGQRERYHDYLVFFQQEMEKNGWEAVLREYLFARTELADDMLLRCFGGIIHPLIQLGFGIEFKQPAIMAEALAETAVHDTAMKKYLLAAEKEAKTHGDIHATLPNLLDQIYADGKLSHAAHWSDSDRMQDGIFARAFDEAVLYAGKWIATPETLAAKTAEMTSTTVYLAASAQHPPKPVKFDFFFLHCVNASIFWPSFNALPDSVLPPADKVRLLEWKARVDLVMYASRGTPPLHLDEVALYTPKLLEAGDADWKGLNRRLQARPDDGHAIKLLRAVMHAEALASAYEEQEKGNAMTEDGVETEEGGMGAATGNGIVQKRTGTNGGLAPAAAEWARIKGFMWLKVGNMVVDSVENVDESGGGEWVRNAGFEEAWMEYKDKPRNDVLEVKDGTTV